MFTLNLVGRQSIIRSDTSRTSGREFPQTRSGYVCVRGSVCHSGIKFMRAMRRAQTDKLVEVQCEKGALGEEKGVAPELPAGSQCPELAQHVDTEPGPDLKPPFLPEGKRWRDWRIRATSASWSLVYLFFSFLSDHTGWLLFSLFLSFSFLTLRYWLQLLSWTSSLLLVAFQREVRCRVLSLDVSGMQRFIQRQFSRVKACQPELGSVSSHPAARFG